MNQSKKDRRINKFKTELSGGREHLQELDINLGFAADASHQVVAGAEVEERDRDNVGNATPNRLELQSRFVQSR